MMGRVVDGHSISIFFRSVPWQGRVVRWGANHPQAAAWPRDGYWVLQAAEVTSLKFRSNGGLQRAIYRRTTWSFSTFFSSWCRCWCGPCW